ncbi:hypothetical protein PR202_gb11989 [Eleusine coracana subsp. coracana]|uniref:Uncharacterized protein n=1 Tax=Eleusine coracana subsp. coracana TaxID=191504 RepID=A0AAV5END3_ELECO|nr:hypothetical protein PR202_gb11989 [Eleusine coracana subsp. coracana]
MVATLGSGECGGSVYIMDLSEIADSSLGSWSTSTRNRRVASLDRTVWAADCNSDGTRAAFGELILGLNHLVALSSDENYFLGSSMDGSIKLFDLRFSKKGGIQSYDGHVNSHTHLPLVIDPSETLVMSGLFILNSHKLVIHVAFFMPGGEDCTVRIWSIKTGELIFAQRVADTLFTALSWPESSPEMCGSLLFDVNHSWGAWLGSRDGLFYMHGT